ncbi:MAG TPA: FecR domain-containing protein [Pyrinomonadaceae bacterium]|nr:FecR domain-containing protein [Pyrinomonadaceae bacterium]
MSKKTGRFDFDWWVIQKRVIYLGIALVVLCGLAGGSALYVWKYGNPLKNVGNSVKMPAGARLVSFEGDVRVIRAATRETIVPGSDTELYPGDTVQTQASGRARVSMADGSTLVVRPNSTIIIRDNASADGGKKTTVHVVVDSGQMSVRTEKQPEGTNNVVETPKTKSKMGEQTGASFGVNPEGTEEIRVNTGAIETTNRNGEKTILHGGEYVSINPSGTISRPQKLLDMPIPSEPGELERVSAGGNGAANISLKWQRPQSGAAAFYRVEVATSPFFVADGKVIERDQLASTEFTASDLRPGVYFWRVRATAATGQTSDWSEPRKFLVVTRGTGTRVPVSSLTAELLWGRVYLIRGRSEPGTTIKVASREIIVPTEGSFQIQTAAPAGAQEITIEAADPRGNSTPYRLSLSGRSGSAKG